MSCSNWRMSMHLSSRRSALASFVGRCHFVAFGLVAVVVTGCGSDPKTNYTSVSKPPTVRVLSPPVRDIVRVVGQPSFIESYERTSIYPKMTAYIEKWIVDIGDPVTKGEVLATLFVPEIVEELNTKKASVELDTRKIELAQKMVDVADAQVKAAQAHLDETKAILAKFQAEVDRWTSEVARLSKESDRGVVAPQNPTRIDKPA